MKKLLQHIPFALMTFIMGVVISPIRFKETGIGCGRMPGGGGFSVTSYSSSYFVRLWSSSAGYSSAEKANEAFQTQAKDAIEVIEQTPKFDKAGQRVGERALAIFSNQEGDERIVCVFWTDKRLVCSICSPSLMHVLDFEKNQKVY